MLKQKSWKKLNVTRNLKLMGQRNLALLPQSPCDLLKNRFRSSKKNRNLSIYLQEYVYPIKERNAYMKNAMLTSLNDRSCVKRVDCKPVFN